MVLISATTSPTVCRRRGPNAHQSCGTAVQGVPGVGEPLGEECQMTCLELSPAITAIRARPEEFEFSNNTLHHLGSRHRFRFVSEDEVEIHAACDCAILRASREQAKVFHAAYRDWYASYWRPLEINREFASHFEPSLWRRLAIWLLRRLLSGPQAAKSSSVQRICRCSRSADGPLRGWAGLRAGRPGSPSCSGY